MEVHEQRRNIYGASIEGGSKETTSIDETSMDVGANKTTSIEETSVEVGANKTTSSDEAYMEIDIYREGEDHGWRVGLGHQGIGGRTLPIPTEA